METERKRWKLGDDVSAEDNILDGFTFQGSDSGRAL